MTALASPETSQRRPPRPSAFDRAVDVALLVGLVFAAVSMLRMLPAGLSTDEFLTVWATDGSFGDAFTRSFEKQGQSPLYFMVLWGWRQLAGSSEAMLRLPSLAFGVAAAVAMARLASSIVDRRSVRLIAVFALIAQTEVLRLSGYSRPYTLVLLFAILSTDALLRWLDGGGPRWGYGWVALLALTAYGSPFAVVLAVPHLIVILWHRRTRDVPEPGLVRTAAVGGLVLVPMIPQLYLLGQRTDELIITSQPTLAAFNDAFVPVAVMLLFGFGFRSASAAASSGRALVLGISWWLAPPVIMWLVGAVTGGSYWLPRYYVVAAPGVAYLVGLTLYWMRSDVLRLALAVVVVAFGMAQINDAVRRHEMGFGIAIDEINSRSPADGALVMWSPFVEATDPALVADPEWQPYLFSPLEYYPTDLELVRIHNAPGNVVDLDRELDRLVAAQRPIAFLGPLGANQYVVESGRELVERGYEEQVLGRTIRVYFAVYTPVDS